MADKGIIFSAPMVRALLDGRKTQTRRIIKPQPESTRANGKKIDHVGDYCTGSPIAGKAYYWRENGCWNSSDPFHLPYAPGDRLYVREAYYQFGHWEPVEGKLTKGGKQKWAFVGDNPLIVFDEPDQCRMGRHHKDPETPAWHKRLGRFMLRGLSRMWLEVTDVRVQRLQEISEDDARAEGVAAIGSEDAPDPDFRSYVWAFSNLWNSLHTADGETWEANPWIVAVSFKVHMGNVDG